MKGGGSHLEGAEDKRWQAATHEAGHAVVCVALEHEFVRITLEGPSGTRGAIEYPQPGSGIYQFNNLDSPEKIRDRLRAALAGGSAEERAGFQTEPGSAAQDLKVAQKICDILSADVHEEIELFQQADEEVEAILEERWQAVELVAAELVEQSELSQEDVQSLMAEL